MILAGKKRSRGEGKMSCRHVWRTHEATECPFTIMVYHLLRHTTMAGNAVWSGYYGQQFNNSL